jgi:phosphatidylglycerophosphatase A
MTPEPASAPDVSGTRDGIDTAAGASAAARRPTVGFLLRHPARWIALGFGSGLSPVAPGTVGTLWAWVAFLVLDRVLDDTAWAWLLVLSLIVGLWACSRTAAELGAADPASIVWDEVVAFWFVLLLVADHGLAAQFAAFALFRYLDAVKPGPVGWADRLLEGRPQPWARGLGILFDDLVAAGCTLVVIAASIAIAEVAWP